METVTTVGVLQAMLLDARQRTLDLIRDLDGAQLMGPRLAVVNPMLWEIGHLAWFQEYWCLRHLGGTELSPSLRSDADPLYDSSNVPHDIRWDLPLPSLDDTLKYMQNTLGLVLENLETGRLSPEQRYFAQLAVFHEDMHDEAFVYTRQTLGYPPPRALPPVGA
ncbi:MAG: DinB family protein, partial [Burkholderiales bacterium]